VIVYDDLSRGHREFVKWGKLIEGNLGERTKLRDNLLRFVPDAVIHLAAYAYVGESVQDPHLYYENNVNGTLSLLWAMREARVSNIILSSSCATYGEPERLPITEDMPQRPVNPYGASKLMSEQMCKDFHVAHGIRYLVLRYFNACGADPDAEVGERHNPEPHVIPQALMAADRVIDAFQIYGDDYETPDGTCIRDFIHVNDLGEAHIAAARYLIDGGKSDAVNLGTGEGRSIQDIIRTVEQVTGRKVPLAVVKRRVGDPAKLVADTTKATRILNWHTRYSDLETIVATAWQWHCKEKVKMAFDRP
jgi:UDP-arabinose 4-epimerase